MIIKVIANKPIRGQININSLIGKTFLVVGHDDTNGSVHIAPFPMDNRIGHGANMPMILNKGEFRRVHRKG